MEANQLPDDEAEEYSIEWRLREPVDLTQEKKRELREDLIRELGVEDSEDVKHFDHKNKELIEMVTIGSFVISSLSLYLQFHEKISNRSDSTTGIMKADKEYIYHSKKRKVELDEDDTVLKESETEVLYISHRELVEVSDSEDAE